MVQRDPSNGIPGPPGPKNGAGPRKPGDPGRHDQLLNGSPRRTRAAEPVRYFLGEKHRERVVRGYPVAKVCHAERLYVNGREPQLLLLSQYDESVETLLFTNRTVSPAEGNQIVHTIRSTVSLNELDLTSCSIRSDLLYEIIAAFAENTTLVEVRLNFLHLGMVRHNHVSLVHTLRAALQGNTVLRRLHLERNDLGPAGLQVIAAMLEENFTIEELLLGRNNLTGGMACLGEALAVNESLVTLKLSHNRLNDADVEVLCELLPHNVVLETLDLEGNEIGPGVVGRVKTLTKNSGTVVRVKNGTGAIAMAIEINTTLNVLNLRGNKLNSSGAAVLADSLKVIHRPLPVGLPPQYRHTDEKLDIPGFGLVLAEKIRKIRNDGHLKSVDISNNSIRASGAAAFAPVINVNPWLIEVRISGNDFRVAGARAFAKHLASSKTLLLLDISENELGDSGCIVICKALQSPECGLQTLFLGANHINRVGAEAIAEVLHVNNTLTHLDIAKSNIRDSGAELLGEAVGANRSLTTLNLTKCNMAEFCDELLSGIANGKQVRGGNLTKLSIADNRMTTEGMDKLAAVLLKRNIQYLDMSNNYDIGRQGGIATLASVCAEPAVKLVELDVRFCGVRADIDKLLHSLEGNNKLRSVKVEEPELPSHWYSEFRNIVQRNKRRELDEIEAELSKGLVFDGHSPQKEKTVASMLDRGYTTSDGSQGDLGEQEEEDAGDDEDDEEEEDVHEAGDGDNLDYMTKIARAEERATVARASRLTVVYGDDDKTILSKLGDQVGGKAALDIARESIDDSYATPKGKKHDHDGDDSGKKKEKRKSRRSSKEAPAVTISDITVTEVK